MNNCKPTCAHLIDLYLKNTATFMTQISDPLPSSLTDPLHFQMQELLFLCSLSF